MRRQPEGSNDIDLDELKELQGRFPTKVWVTHLLLSMRKESVDSLTLQKSKGIPPIPGEEEVPPGGFDFDKIINRLKVMSGFDPVVFKKPRSGRITLTICDVSYDVTTTFVDSAADSQCTITMHLGRPQ